MSIRISQTAHAQRFLEEASGNLTDGGNPRAKALIYRILRDTVRRLIGKMAHPLNLPGLDGLRQQVISGYAILQPRVTPALPLGLAGSVYQRISSSRGGIEPYAAASSDVYQDLFQEGSFTGKGIYHVDAFMAAMAGRVPDNSLLGIENIVAGGVNGQAITLSRKLADKGAVDGAAGVAAFDDGAREL